jgi:hypothetical protein
MDDTRPEVHALQIGLYRQMTTAKKVEILGDLWQTVRELALVGLRSRHPEFSEEQQQDELATLMLGPELGALVAKARRLAGP